MFTYIVNIPILEKEEGQIQRIIPIPHLIQNGYFFIIPDHDYVIKYRDWYVPTDKETVSNSKGISDYIVIPLKELDLDLACENNIEEERIFEPSLLLGNKCKLNKNYDLLNL